MTQQEHIVIVGASAAGLSILEGLRREGFDGRVTMVGEEDRAPYDRPPLTKRFMTGDWDADRTRLRTADDLSALDAQWLLGTRAESLDLTNRSVTLSTGDSLGYDQLVIATGVTPRTIPGTEGISGVHTLKSLDDAITLRAELAAGPAVAVIGAGPLGSEFAATARAKTDQVTLIDPFPTPLYRQLGQVAGAHIADLHRKHGVSLRMGVGAAKLLHDRGRLTGVRLTDGTTVEAQLVLVAIGSVPNTAWLTGTGLNLNDGVVCDPTCAAAPHVYAAGDVARWYNPAARRLMRIEHRMNATEQGLAVARNLPATARRTRRRPTSGPTTTTPPSRYVAPADRTRNELSLRATWTVADSSPCTARTTWSAPYSAATASNRPAATSTCSPARTTGLTPSQPWSQHERH